MSNTSKVTPYDTTSAQSTPATGTGVAESCAVGAAAAAVVAAACIVGMGVGAVALARWLAPETPEDRASLDRLKEERRHERLGSRTAATNPGKTPAEPLRLDTVGLHLRDPESLVRSAEKLGYRMEPLAHLSVPPAGQPPILLRHDSGERLAIGRNAKGRLVVCTAGDRRHIQALVRQHTLDRAVEHLAGKGMSVQTKTLPSGEVRILARERDAGRRDGAAEVKAQVHTDGTAWVDVDCIRGNRCETLVSELAQTIGGEVSSMTKKSAYFQLPGEPAKTRVKV